MRKFVTPVKRKQRQPKKRMIVRTEAKKNSWIKVFLFYYRKWIVGLLVTAGLIYIFFYHSFNPIKRIVFTDETHKTFSYTSAFEEIQMKLIWKWYYKEKRFQWWSMENEIKENYPLIANISPASFINGTLTLSVTYNEPDFIMKTENNVEWLVYKNTILPYSSWTALWSWGIHIAIALPEDIVLDYSWGVFWQSPSQHIARTIKQISFISWFSSVTYYPWREKLSLSTHKDTFIIWLAANKLKETFTEWEKIMPYLPSEIPSKVDLSNPQKIIIQH